MKWNFFFAAAVLAAALSVSAQDKPAEGQRPRRAGGNPIISALDANKDGEIDASEINNAPAALRKLDKNGDGKLTREELRPAGAGQGKNANGERPKRPKKQNQN